MKKNYSKPAVTIVMLHKADLIATSGTTATMEFGGSDSGTGTAESRQHWFDDEW